MKIFGVLAILSTLYTQGASFTCYKVADFTTDANSIELVEETCVDVTTCVRPKITDTAYEATGSKWGCGVCDPVASCVSCETDNCNEEPIKCLDTDDFTEDPASKFCPDTDAVETGIFKPAEKKCVRPIMKDAGYEATDSKWGCGVCTTPAACWSCETDNCNVAPTFKCLTTDDFTKEPVSKVCPDRIPTLSAAFEPETACVRPKMTDTDYEATDSKWGCGVCDDATSCVSCVSDDCNVAPTFKCLTGAADAVPSDSKLCPDTDAAVDDTFVPETECVRPEFSYAVVGAVKYGCGNCNDGSDDVENCKTCPESDCNSIPTDPKHNCYTYSLGEDDKWAASADMAVCVSGDGVAGKCNMPADLAVKAGYTEGGCGPCVKDNVACTDTDAEKNVGQKAVVSLLVTILPLLYVML